MSTPGSNTSDRASVPGELQRLLVLLAVGIAAFDGCFWKIDAVPGFSLAVFFSVITTLIVLSTEKIFFAGKILTLLLAGSVVAAIIETSFTNTLSLLLLTVALAGEAHFQAVSSSWARWQLQVIALIRAPGRLFWLAGRLLELDFLRSRDKGQSWYLGALLTVPILVLALVFGLLLADGNAIFSHWTGTFFAAAWHQLLRYLDLGRISFWILGALLLLPLLRPVVSGDWSWRWSHTLPRFTEASGVRSGAWPSLLALGLMNVLFFLANAADLIFLWSGHSLPPGVTYAQFVHEGTEALIATVLLSALVLTLIFQQSLAISGRRDLKALAYLWVAQNWFLLLSVALRLKLYIETYDMTVTRLGLLLFLALVAAGYVLLIIKIQAQKSLFWLLGGAIIAVTLTFYIAQFLNFAGWTADYNVAQWKKAQFHRNLDVFYLHRLGPAAWPALYRARQANPAIDSDTCDDPSYVDAARADFTFAHWREWSLRGWRNRWALGDGPPK